MQPFDSRPVACKSGSLAEDPWSIGGQSQSASPFQAAAANSGMLGIQVRWNAGRRVVRCERQTRVSPVLRCKCRVPVAQTNSLSLTLSLTLSLARQRARDSERGTPEERRRRCRRAGLESGHQSQPRVEIDSPLFARLGRDVGKV